MLPSTSPNDPIFFMNHCNVDRIWEAWMQKPGGPGRVYVPGDSEPASLKGHRLHDTLSSLLSALHHAGANVGRDGALRLRLSHCLVADCYDRESTFLVLS